MKNFHEQYAMAMYSLAKDEKCQKKYLDELCLIDTELSENKDYIKLLDSPMITMKEKADMIDAAFSNEVSEYILNFLKILCEHKKVRLFSKCTKEFGKLYDEEYNIERVEAVTAVALDDKQLAALKEKMSTLTKKDAIIKNVVDPSCLGGMILRFGTNQIDASVKSGLEAIKKEIFNMAV